METSTVEIVRLPVEQWPAYRQIRLEALRDSPQAFGSTYTESLARPDSQWQTRLEEAAKGEEVWLLFARIGERLVGMIGAYVEEKVEPPVAAIVSMYVTPAERGKGISTRLMQAILETLQAAGIYKAVLGVNVDQTAALHLYQRFGFTIYETVVNRMGDGVDHSEYLMEHILQAQLR
jgi:ribosomal protein S18 acetylase RimI-like enzyme